MAGRRGVPIVWTLVRDCMWEDNAVLRQHQCLQDPARDGPLADHASPETELARLFRKIRDEHLLHVEAPMSVSVDAQLPGASVGPLAAIERPPVQVRGAVPERPSIFVARNDELDRLRAQLVDGQAATVGVTGTPPPFGLHGQGGIGKTVLAAELVRDPRTLAHFPDGVF